MINILENIFYIVIYIIYTISLYFLTIWDYSYVEIVYGGLHKMAFSIAIMLIAGIIAFYMAWNIGANDVANAMASAVGAKAITYRQAVLIAGVLTFLGSVLVGSHVTDTIKKGIIDAELIDDRNTMIIGMVSTLLAASIWITIATWKSMPISTSHSIIGALIGFGLVAEGAEVVQWGKVSQVAASWILSPLLAGVLSYFIFKFIAKSILAKKEPIEAAKIITPIFIFATFIIISLSLFLKTRLGKEIGSDSNILMVSLLIAFVSSFFSIFIINKMASKVDNVEDIFKGLQVFTSCYVAFSIGANDVANSIGPFSAIYSFAKTSSDTISPTVNVPIQFLFLGGMGITIGILTWGYRVMQTVGSKITVLTNTRGFAIDFSGATSVLLASKMGMPVSTTHAVIGAVIGVGLARGLEAVDFSIVKKIAISWVITLPIAGGTAVLLFLGISSIF